MAESVLTILHKMSHFIVSFLFRESIYSTTVFVLILLLQWMFRKSSHFLQTGLWLLVFLRLVLPTDLSHPFSGRMLIIQWIDLHMIQSLDGWMGEEHDEIPSSLITGQGHPTYQNQWITLDGQTILFLLWIGGVGLISVLYIRRLIHFHRLIRSGHAAHQIHAEIFLHDWRQRLDVRRSVRLIATSTTLSPFTSGIRKPVILIPEPLLDLKRRSDLESVIAHEMAHIKRLDDLWIKLQNLIQMIYFFHPIAWMAGSRLHVGRECACDSLVLSQGYIQRESYARGLLNMIKMNTLGPDCVTLIPSFSSERNSLFTRLKHMKGEHNMRGIHKIGMIVLLAGLAMLVLPMAAVPLSDQQGGESQLSSPIAADDAASPSFRLILPIQGGRIAAGFGERRDPIRKDKIQFHKGIDIPGKKGTPVLATADGVVTVAKAKDYDPNAYGKYLILQHPDGFETVYAQLDSILVREGMSVTQGTAIGEMGQSGRSTGPHLHFEVRINEKAVDPVTYLESK